MKTIPELRRAFVYWIFWWVVCTDIGMVTGYILNRYKTAPAAITPFINIVLWMMSLGALLLLVFGVWNGTLNLLWTALYVSLGHSGEKHHYNDIKQFDLFTRTERNKWRKKRFDSTISICFVIQLFDIQLVESNLFSTWFTFYLNIWFFIKHEKLVDSFKANSIIRFVFWTFCMSMNENKKPLAWGLALIWIVLSCKWGLARPINRLLSLRAMLPLSRLTYCAYLIHPVSQIAMSLNIKGTIHIQHGFVFTIFLGNVVISYTLALVLSLLFEAPIIRLLKIMFSK